EYSVYRLATELGGVDNIPGNVLYQITKIGISEKNEAAIKKYNKELNQQLGPGNEIMLPTTGTHFYAPEGSVNWCAGAQTAALKDSGWKKGKARWYSYDEQLLQGDILSIITSTSPPSGHVVAVLNQQGNRMDVVSGNAGGGGGSVRIDAVEIERKPAGYNWNDAIKAQQNNQPYTKPSRKGVVWIINVTPIESIDPNIKRERAVMGPDDFDTASIKIIAEPGSPATVNDYDPSEIGPQGSPLLTDEGEKGQEASPSSLGELTAGEKAGGEKLIMEESPKTPEEDPAFQQIKSQAETVKTKQKKHGKATDKVVSAQKASSIPVETELSSQAQFHQVGKMEKQEAQEFNAAAFKAQLMKRVEDALPKDDEQTKEQYKDNPSLGKRKLDEARENMKKDVKAEKDNAGNAIASTTEAKPSREGTAAKEVVPMEGEKTGKRPHIPNSETAAPKPRSNQEISMEKEAASLDEQMTQNQVSESQLQKSNEPAFTEALDHKHKAQEQARNAPAEYRTKEQPQLDKAKEDAQSDVAKGLGSMFGARSGQFNKVQGSKSGTKAKDEAKRLEVANKLKEIYTQTKQNVEAHLNTLEKDVIKEFDDASKRAMDNFEHAVGRRLGDYYSGFNILGLVADFVTGRMDAKVERIFRQEKASFMSQMDTDITKISNKVATGLNAAKELIKTGKRAVDSYWKSLRPDLKKLAQGAKDEISGQFVQLEQSVNDRHGKLLETLEKKFVENVSKLKEEFDKIKAEKKGWIGAAFDYMAGVIKTILELKNMLFETLAKAKDSVMKIIDDPIQFLKNLITAVKLGLNNFIKNILKHLKKGFMDWLLGNVPPDVHIPEKWDLTGIFKFIMSILGLTWSNIRTRAVKKLG
ncbi:MAG: hypothetical protein AAGC85_25770, partial [Bacteroidota bacterium]